ncbi:hypothetical protein BLAT2472_130113 [Burkholderia latens]
MLRSIDANVTAGVTPGNPGRGDAAANCRPRFLFPGLGPEVGHGRAIVRNMARGERAAAE